MLAAELLLAALRRHWPLARSVRNVRVISGGASQEIWALDLETLDGVQALILRRTRQWSDAAQAGSAGMAVEAALLSLAISHGVPAPQPMGNLVPQDGLGDGYFMMHVDGETSPRKILTEPRFAAARTTLASECGALMARIHALPLTELPANLQLREGRAEQERAHWLAAHRNNGTARPVFELAFRWLLDHPLRDDGSSVLVHGDFRNGNLVVGCEGVKAVLDWELAHRGDAMEDLGWFCVNSWRFGHSHLAAGGLGTREQLFQGYEAQAGCRVDPARVHWWQVLGTLKWGITCDAMGLAWRNGSDPQIERLAVARRVSETEADLMHLIAPGGIA